MKQQMTSLARQLGQLKTEQKDEITLQSRAKISFLFDVQKAANIDDQTLYYICQSGISQLEGVCDLTAFQGDILNEKSLQFYRGTETIATLEPIDKRLELLLKLLAPHLVDSAAHKVLEYLIRIYDVHVHHKALLLNAFLPYFETAYFLRMIQLLNLQNDQEYGFLHQYAYQGKAIEKTTLVKFLGRNSGLVFIKFAEFCFSLLEIWGVNIARSSGHHWKFYGSMIVEVLRAHTNDQNLMFNCLPFISKSLKQKTVRDLQISGFLAISQLACRKTLSAEYTQAFVRQTLQTVANVDASDEDLSLKGLTVLLFLAMYQGTTMVTLNQKDFKLAAKIDGLPQLLKALSANYDTSSLAKVFVMTILKDSQIDLERQGPLIQSMIKDHLKTTYILVQALIFEGINEDSSLKQRSLAVLNLLKELQPHEFNQSAVYLLKRLSNDALLKEKVLSLLSGSSSESGQSNLISTFGDQEYSILNALSSSHQPTKLSALQALQEEGFIKKLLENERALVKLVLLQTISQQIQTVDATFLMINAIVNLKRAEKNGQDDTEFECLEILLDQIHRSKELTVAFSQDLKEKLASVLVNEFNVNSQGNQAKQVWIALCFSITSTKLNQSRNAFFGFLQAVSLNQQPQKGTPQNQNRSKSPNKISNGPLIEYFVSKPIQAVRFMLEIFTGDQIKVPAYIDYSMVASLLMGLGKITKTNMMRSTFTQQLYIPLLKAIHAKKVPHADKILGAIVSALPSFESSLLENSQNLTCIESLLRVAVSQKQADPSTFNFAGLFQTLFDTTLGRNKTLLCDLLVQTAIESECTFTRIFACLQLTKLHQNLAVQTSEEGSSVLRLKICLHQEVAAGLVLMLLNDTNSVIRHHAMELAQAYEAALFLPNCDTNIVTCFDSNKKIISQAKRSADKFVALKKPITAHLLKTLSKVKLELIEDRNQLGTTLNKVKNQEIFEHLVRSLSDYPSFISKGKLISVLSNVPHQTLVFAMNLCKVQDKLFAELNEHTTKTGKMDPSYVTLLIQLAGLVATQHQQSIQKQEAAHELMVSLILPFLQFMTQSQEMFQREINSSIEFQASISKMKDAIVNLFEQNIIVEICLKDAEDKVIKDIFKLYLSLQSGLLKGSNDRLKSLFINSANEKLFSGKQLAMVLQQTLSNMLANKTDTNAIDILLETIIQVQTVQSRESLNQEAISVISHLTDAYCNKKNPDVQPSEYAFTIELASQLYVQTLTQKTKSGDESTSVTELLASHVAKVLAHTKIIVDDVLKKKTIQTQDPFSEFMAASKNKNNGDEEMKGDQSNEEMDDQEDDIEVELLPSYQILLSLLYLLGRVETAKSMQLNSTAQMLKEVSFFVRETVSCDTTQVTKQKQIAQALFQLYHSAVLRTTLTANSEKVILENFALKDCLFDYTNLIVDLFDGAYEELMRDGRVYLNVLINAGFSTYAFLASLILITRAVKDLKLKITETLEFDCSTPKSSGAAIYLLKLVLLSSLEQEQSLATIELLTYSISQVRFSDDISKFLEEKTRLVFAEEQKNPMRQAINGLATWVHTTLLQGNEKTRKKFMYLAICLLQQWISGQAEFQAQLARLAGTETPSPQIQTQLVNCFLASYLIAQTNTTMLNQEKTHTDKQFKSSLLRLSRNTKQLQQALNEMFSLQIHVEIVLKILNFGDEDSGLSNKDKQSLIPLKNNCLQLLNEKISSYNQGFLAKAAKPVQDVYKRLIQRAIDLLKENAAIYHTAGSKTQHLNDITSLNENLMAILQYTCCSKTLSRKMQAESLDVVQAYQKIFQDDNQQLKLLQLQTQLTLTEFYLFEAYALTILEHLPAFFDHVVQGFAKVKQIWDMKGNNEQFLFVDTYQSALLKASISITSIFFKFLNAKQLEALITAVATTKAASSSVIDESSQVSIVLDTISMEAKAHKKMTVHAAFNAYNEVVTQAICTTVFETQASRYFSELLCPVLKNLPAKFVQEHSKKFLIFLKECFALSYKASKQGKQVSDAIQSSIVECFNSFIVKLTEEQLRPVILSVTKWAMKEKSEQEFDFHKAVIFCKLLSGVLDTLKEFFVPLLAIFFEPAILKIILTLTKLLKGAGAKRSRAQLEHENVPQELSEKLLTDVCRALQLLFKHDASCFIQNDSFEKLCDPVADLLSLLKVTDYMGFVEKSVKPLVFEMDDRINDDSMWQKMNYTILMKTRSEQWQVRKSALIVIEYLFETLRERYLIVLNDTIPFLSELLEDEHEQVETTAKRIVQRVEQMTGESINDYLK